MTLQYSIAPTILYEIITDRRADELTLFERLFIAENAGLETHKRWHNKLYMECGCFAEAEKLFSEVRHARKLGDLAWVSGDLDGATKFYSYPAARYAQVCRGDKDWDRLIKLAFFRGDWDGVTRLIAQAPISPGLGKGRIVLGNSEMTGSPYLQMLAVALAKSGAPLSDELEGAIRNGFQLNMEDWRRLAATATDVSESKLAKLREKCLPRPARIPALSLKEACARGDTPRSRSAVQFIKEADDLLMRAHQDLKAFLQTGKQECLDAFLGAVLRSGLSVVSHRFLSASMVSGSDGLGAVPTDRLIQLYGSHPIMNKRYFGQLLDAKFRSEIPVTASDVITGIFQKMGSTFAEIERRENEKSNVLDFRRLMSCRDWAKMRLCEWVSADGKALIDEAATVWRTGKAKAAGSLFCAAGGRADTPREAIEWNTVVEQATQWLEALWQREIGTSPWISENRMYPLLKQRFKPLDVIQHARPIWLSPQHLDTFIPELSLAVEYMGLQHYKPVDFFGGVEGFEQIVERDRRKATVCKQVGVKLVYIRYDEDIKGRVGDIETEFRPKRHRGLVRG